MRTADAQAKHVQLVFVHLRTFIQLASACKKPADGVASASVASYLQSLQAELASVSELRDRNRGDKVFFNHLSTVSEGIPAAGWIAVVRAGARCCLTAGTKARPLH